MKLDQRYIGPAGGAMVAGAVATLLPYWGVVALAAVLGAGIGYLIQGRITNEQDDNLR